MKAFKIKTNERFKYGVIPKAGELQPNETVKVKIVLWPAETHLATGARAGGEQSNTDWYPRPEPDSHNEPDSKEDADEIEANKQTMALQQQEVGALLHAPVKHSGEDNDVLEASSSSSSNARDSMRTKPIQKPHKFLVQTVTKTFLRGMQFEEELWSGRGPELWHFSPMIMENKLTARYIFTEQRLAGPILIRDGYPSSGNEVQLSSLIDYEGRHQSGDDQDSNCDSDDTRKHQDSDGDNTEDRGGNREDNREDRGYMVGAAIVTKAGSSAVVARKLVFDTSRDSKQTLATQTDINPNANEEFSARSVLLFVAFFIGVVWGKLLL